jgi:hypothetical protein
MTLTIHTDLIQRSDEWHAARRGIITASAIGNLVTPKTIQVANNPDSRRTALILAAERITGWSEENGYISDDMMRGIEDEPKARAKYSEHHAPAVEVGFMTEDEFGFTIGYSPDGLVGDDGLIEIKSRRPKAQLETILAGAPPIENMAQLQCALLVTGRAWIDYVSYCGGMPLWVHRIEPDQKWFDAILAATQKLEDSIADMLNNYADLVVGLPPTDRTLTEEMVF